MLLQTTRICEHCTKQFYVNPRNPKQRFCGQFCSNKVTALRRVVPHRPCERCGKSFHPTQKSTQFCSRECSIKSTSERRRAVTEALGYPRESACPNCGKTLVHPSPSDEKRIYCSHSCASAVTSPAFHQRRYESGAKPFSTAEWNRELKRQAMDAYGGACACCGESRIEFLQLDHVNDDGPKHRYATGRSAGGGFYSYLRKHGWPNDPPLQVLCGPCNWAFGTYGKCPHDMLPPRRKAFAIRSGILSR